MKITAAELRMSEIKKNAEFEKCLKLAEQLDSLNEQLQLQIEKCGRNLQHFEFVSNLCKFTNWFLSVTFIAAYYSALYIQHQHEYL